MILNFRPAAVNNVLSGKFLKKPPAVINPSGLDMMVKGPERATYAEMVFTFRLAIPAPRVTTPPAPDCNNWSPSIPDAPTCTLYVLPDAKVVAVPFPDVSVAPAVVWLPEQAQLRPQVDGFVEQLLLPDGAPVNAGDLIARLRNPELLSAREQLASIDNAFV